MKHSFGKNLRRNYASTKLIESMPKRMAVVIKNKGGPTRYSVKITRDLI